MQTQQQGTGPAPVGIAVGGSLFANYAPPLGQYDELLASPGNMRSHWHTCVRSLELLGKDELHRRWTHAQRLIHENGVAYDMHRDQRERSRPWELDALPVVINQAEWDRVAAGLRQRAEVLELTLQDLLGPQQLIRNGVLPAEVLHCHPAFFPALHGLRPPLERYLHFYAADLGRSANGSWWTMADRCEAPSGMGYALENRIVISRMLPEAIRACHVQRLASYFITLRETCHRIAPRHQENPRVVVLSQGPESENYFEDAYLSRYLGYTLVEGADLTVRDRCVWLKTLGGLYPVDVIMRRPNTGDLDPLELPTTSAAAIPGLVDAVRAGNVGITNPLGSGLVESPVFLAFMQTLCKTLLDQDLLLPSVATWWCGDPVSREYVLANLPRLRVKRSYRTRGADSRAIQELGATPPDQLAAMITKNPAAFVGQEIVMRSTVPDWNQGTVAPTYLALRSFLYADGDGFEVLDGALGRTSRKMDSLELSLLRGEGSKDVWIQGTAPPQHETLLRQVNEPVQLRRSGGDLPSRVADDVFWLGRQIERANSSARLLRTVALRLSSEWATETHPELRFLIHTLADQGQIEPGFVVAGIKDQLPAIEAALPRLAVDRQFPGSLSSIAATVHQTASRVRDRVSNDTWRIIVRLNNHFPKLNSNSFDLTDLLNVTNELIVDLAALVGMVSESMTRALAFRFMDLGIRIERASQVGSLLSNCFQTQAAIGPEILESLLEVGDSIMTYRSRYLATLELAPVLDLLVTDDTNPRSILYQLERIRTHLDSLPQDPRYPAISPVQQLLLSALHAVQMLDVERASEQHARGDASDVENVLDQLQRYLPELSQEVLNRYMVHSGPARLLTTMDPSRMGRA